MHYHCEVWIKDNKEVESQVKEAMSPYYENEGENDKGFWDWYQISGRWKGTHDPTYDANKDTRHLIPCSLCKSTGLREDWGYWEDDEKIFNDDWARQCNGCNGCKGTGMEVTWPTQWKPHPKDVLPIKKILDTLTCATLILPQGAFQDEEWNGHDFIPTDFKGKTVNEYLKKYNIEDGYLVTVDYHC